MYPGSFALGRSAHECRAAQKKSFRNAGPACTGVSKLAAMTQAYPELQRLLTKGSRSSLHRSWNYRNARPVFRMALEFAMVAFRPRPPLAAFLTGCTPICGLRFPHRHEHLLESIEGKMRGNCTPFKRLMVAASGALIGGAGRNAQPPLCRISKRRAKGFCKHVLRPWCAEATAILRNPVRLERKAAGNCVRPKWAILLMISALYFKSAVLSAVPGMR